MTAPSRNIELKARLASLDDARIVCRELAEFSAKERQVDTYFQCRHGRLKLRERRVEAHSADASDDQLVWYLRPDDEAVRASDYLLLPVKDAAALKAVLAAALGVMVVVEKRREIFLYRNVRIHLDRVERLGDFLEFEAVLGPGDDDAANAELVRELAARFALSPSMLIEGSYSDLLLVKRGGGG